VVYHGTRAGEFESFKTRFRKGEQLGFGVHFSEDRSMAERYADDEHVARRGRSPHVFDVYLDIKNPLDATAIVKEGDPEFDLA